jgi:hypothetical protein
MIEIPLTQGKVALVDDEDFDFLNQWKWCAHVKSHTSYAERCVWNSELKKCRYLGMHRVIMNPIENMEVDHINHNGLDNRKCNLRIVTHRENIGNRVDKSKYNTGVRKSGKGFIAQYAIGKRIIYLGFFKTPEEASFAYINRINNLQNE